MNHFQGRKKTGDNISAPHLSKLSNCFRIFGRSKKTKGNERQREFVLAAALPFGDDFRTSLLMTSLSTRFSLLREKHDQSAKVGRDCDDSGLWSTCQSQMIDSRLGSRGDSITALKPVNTPPSVRITSFQSSNNGAPISSCIKDRAKLTKGNNMFGGRQKIYKIAAASVFGPDGSPKQALYSDDSAQSTLQRGKQGERMKWLPEDFRLYDTLKLEPQLENDQLCKAGSIWRNGFHPLRTWKTTEAPNVTSPGPALSRIDILPGPRDLDSNTTDLPPSELLPRSTSISTSFRNNDEAAVPNQHNKSNVPPQTPGRQEDKQYSSFQMSASPTTSSFSHKVAKNKSTEFEKLNHTNPTQKSEHLKDSQGADRSVGLYSMVRQHLRKISVASSVDDSDSQFQEFWLTFGIGVNDRKGTDQMRGTNYLAQNY